MQGYLKIYLDVNYLLTGNVCDTGNRHSKVVGKLVQLFGSNYLAPMQM